MTPYYTDEIEQTINDKLCDGTILIGYGKCGHGMNGKDADLDSVGQCLVKSLETVDPIGAEDMKVLIHLHIYATVCTPSVESVNLEAVKENASPKLKEYFLGRGVDLNRTEEELYDDKAAFDTIVDYFQDQADYIAESANPCPQDWKAFMWSDDAWEGGTDITLEVPLTVDEYDAIESGEDCGVEALDDVAKRIATEIYDANQGGTPERDKLKRFEEEVALWNKLINKLECYHQPTQTNRTNEQETN